MMALEVRVTSARLSDYLYNKYIFGLLHHIIILNISKYIIYWTVLSVS